MRNLKMAVKNLDRHKSRTIILGCMLSFVTFLFMIGLSIADGVSEGLIERIRILNTGDIIITNEKNAASSDAAFDDVQWADQRIEQVDELNKDLKRFNDIKQIRNRIKVTGMVSANGKTGSGVIVGIEPEKEQDMLSSDLRIKEGVFLNEAKINAIYISSTIAEAYNVGIGEQVALYCQANDGKTSMMEFTICGIFEYTSWKEYYVYISIDSARELVRMEGATHILVDLVSKDTKEVCESINEQFKEKYNIVGTSLKNASGLLLATVMVIEGTVFGMCGILFILILVILINNISMSFFERTKEIGVLKALGESDMSIMVTMILETIIISVVSVSIGEILSLLLICNLEEVGINVPIEALRLSFGTDRFYPLLNIRSVMITALIPIGLSFCVTIISLRKVINLSPVNATKVIV